MTSRHGRSRIRARRADLVAGLAVVVSALAVYGASTSPDTVDNPRRSASLVPVPRMTLACPGSPDSTDTRTRVLAVTPGTGSGLSGSIAMVPLSPKAAATPGAATPLAARDRVGVPLMATLDDASPTVVMTGVGQLAPGLAALQWTVSTGAADPALAVSRCQPAADDWWFNAVDTSVDATTKLVLTNPTSSVAVVDLSFYGAQGPVDAVGARDIAVRPGSQTSFDLARFAPGLEAATVHVSADPGRVVAAVHTSTVAGRTPSASEWLPPAQPPATKVLIGALPAGTGERSLVITNPGAREALVTVQVVDEDATFVPTELAEVRVPPGSVVVNDLQPIIKGATAAVRVSSSVPVTGAMIGAGDGASNDLAATSSSPAVTSKAVVPVVERTELVLTFADSDLGGSRVLVQAYDSHGRRVSRDHVDLTGDALSVWQPGRDDPPATYVVVNVLDGDQIYGVATYQGRTGISSVPLVSGPLTVTRPAVYPSL